VKKVIFTYVIRTPNDLNRRYCLSASWGKNYV